MRVAHVPRNIRWLVRRAARQKCLDPRPVERHEKGRRHLRVVEFVGRVDEASFPEPTERRRVPRENRRQGECVH